MTGTVNNHAAYGRNLTVVVRTDTTARPLSLFIRRRRIHNKGIKRLKLEPSMQFFKFKAFYPLYVSGSDAKLKIQFNHEHFFYFLTE